MRKSLALSIALLLFVGPLFAQQQRKYGVQTTVKFTLIDPAGIDIETAGACVTGDVKISKDEGTFVNTSNCFTNEGEGDYSVILTAAEMQAARITVSVKDSATKVWLDWNFHVETYGNTAAQHEVDLDSTGYAQSIDTLLNGTVDTATFTPTTISFESSDLALATGILQGDYVKWTSGPNRGMKREITSYVLISGKGRYTVSVPFLSAPASGDKFIIL